MVSPHDISLRFRLRRPGAVAILHGLPGRIAATVRVWCHRARTRRELAELDAFQFADIGIARHEAQAEAQKPFWRG